MKTRIEKLPLEGAPERHLAALAGRAGFVLLRTAMFAGGARFSYAACDPFLVFRARGTRCELRAGRRRRVLFGNPWRVLESLMARFELPDEADLGWPLGGAFGFWGYELNRFVEPKLAVRAVRDLDVPDAWVGFYDSILVFDHAAGAVSIVSTGVGPDGDRSGGKARRRLDAWRRFLEAEPGDSGLEKPVGGASAPGDRGAPMAVSLPREAFLSRVNQAREAIGRGEIYQVNLSRRLTAPFDGGGWALYRSLVDRSPAPLAGFLNGGAFQIASASPETFLRMSGREVTTRPIKGTRPRGSDAETDARLAFDLQTSRKESAELVMITDLLRNDLGRLCEFGTVCVPELMRLESFPQVHHLVSTVTGRLRPDVSHLGALARSFPGGSITGAPKFRAMEVIDRLEPVARGPYTGCLGYLGFNRESQLNILIRTALCLRRRVHLSVGAGIVWDSDPEAEYEETEAKAAGFRAALAAAGSGRRVANRVRG